MPKGIYKHYPHQLFKKGNISWKGLSLSETHKRNIGLGQKGRVSPMKGKYHTEEAKLKCRLACKGDKAYNYKGGYQNKLMNNRKRRIMRLLAEGSHSLQEWEQLKKFYRYMCLCCKRTEPEIILSEDHIVPLSKGGSDYIENIQPLCRSCNARKYTRIIDYKMKGEYSFDRYIRP